MRITSLLSYILASILWMGSVTVVYGQTSLQPGIAVEHRIAAGQKHRYVVSLQEDQYIRLVVEQKGIDVGIHVTGPEDHWIGDFDSPNGSNAPESIAFVAEHSGDYQFEVFPVDEFRKPFPGTYDIRIVELRKATDHELSAGKPQQALQSKGVALLNEILTDVSAIRNPLTRVGYEAQIADLYWNFDAKSAAALMHHATEIFREALDRSLPRISPDNQEARQLRQTMVQLMKTHEPESALAFVRSTREPLNLTADNTSERQLELSIADAIAPQHPKLAFEIAEDNLKEGLDNNILSTVRALSAKNPEFAAILVHDIAAKLFDQSLIQIPGNAAVAIGLVKMVQSSGNSPKALPAKKEVSLMSDVELRALVQKMTAEVLSFPAQNFNLYSSQRLSAQSLISSLKQMGGELKSIAPANLASIEQQLRSSNPAQAEVVVTVDTSMTLLHSVDDEIAAAHLQEIRNSSAKRDFEDAFIHLDALQPYKREGLIQQIVEDIGPGLKKSTALIFLDRARQYLPASPRAENNDELEILLAFVEPYSRLEPNRGFEIVEPLVDQLNDLALAAQSMNGFGQIYYVNGDFVTSNGNAVAEMAENLSDALGTLAIANFPRAKSDAERIRTLTLRIEAEMAIAKTAISGSDD